MLLDCCSISDLMFETVLEGTLVCEDMLYIEEALPKAFSEGSGKPAFGVSLDEKAVVTAPSTLVRVIANHHNTRFMVFNN